MENPEHLILRSLTVVNESGEPRILLDGGSEGRGCSIVLITKDGKTLQIHEQPDGFVSLAIDGPKFTGEVTLTRRGLCVRDGEGKLGVTIGQFPYADFRGLTVYKDGQPVFQLPV